MKKISHNRTYPSSQKNSVANKNSMANTIFADKREKLKNKIYYTLIWLVIAWCYSSNPTQSDNSRYLNFQHTQYEEFEWANSSEYLLGTNEEFMKAVGEWGIEWDVNLTSFQIQQQQVALEICEAQLPGGLALRDIQQAIDSNPLIIWKMERIEGKLNISPLRSSDKVNVWDIIVVNQTELVNAMQSILTQDTTSNGRLKIWFSDANNPHFGKINDHESSNAEEILEITPSEIPRWLGIVALCKSSLVLNDSTLSFKHMQDALNEWGIIWQGEEELNWKSMLKYGIPIKINKTKLQKALQKHMHKIWN